MSKPMAFETSPLLKWILRGFGIVRFVARGNWDGILWFRRWWVSPLVKRETPVRRLWWFSSKSGFLLEFNFMGKRTNFVKGSIMLQLHNILYRFIQPSQYRTMILVFTLP